MTRQLTALQNKFVELMLEDRYYTNAEMARILDCDERTIYKMRRHPGIADEIEKRADTSLKTRLSHAYGVLGDILFSADTSDNAKLKALQLYLQTQGKLKDKGETDVNVKVSTAEEAERELDKLLNM